MYHTIVNVLIWSVAVSSHCLIHHKTSCSISNYGTRMALIMVTVLQLHNVPCIMIGTENSADAMYSHVVQGLLIHRYKYIHQCSTL